MRSIVTILFALALTLVLAAPAAAAEKPNVGLTTGMLWAYSPSTHTGLPLRFTMGVPLLFKAGALGMALEPGLSSSLASFDLSPSILWGFSGPAGAVRLGGNVAYSYTPPWNGSGNGSHLIATSGALVVPLMPGRLALLLSLGPRYVIGSPTPVIGGGVLFSIIPPPPE